MKKKTYEELENEVAALKRSCASYKSENTKLREKLDGMCKRNTELLLEIGNLKMVNDSYRGACEDYKIQIADYEASSWWERFKDLFWFD